MEVVRPNPTSAIKYWLDLAIGRKYREVIDKLANLSDRRSHAAGKTLNPIVCIV
ncbi:MAG: hypothetical protein SWY16_02835 [Cyanobacteriota bacterium]|nr:hypothetical protein [Cyanobacteriota bacterium]